MDCDALSRELYDELCATPTVDTHEHLPPEPVALARRVDFYSLFEHYCQGDLVSAGATEEDLALWRDRERPLVERWRRFKPFLSAIRTGGYARAALLVVQDLLGFADLDDGTVDGVSEALAAMNRPGLYDRILREHCGLVACIDCWHYAEPGMPGYFYHLAPGRELVDVHEPGALARLESQVSRTIRSLHDLLAAMDAAVERWKADPTVVGIKSAHAYCRPIRFERRTAQEAAATFARLLAERRHELPPADAVPLQDYMMYELVARAEAAGLPMVFHTGLHDGNYHRVADGYPLHLQPLLEAFPRARFDLYHAGMPWVREVTVLAKYFPGVHLNLAWAHIINPAQARSALSEWLDTVPNTKILGFGGDYSTVEKVYGHLKLARLNIARVLAEKVVEGACTRAEASTLVRRLMLENPLRLYDRLQRG